MLKTGGINRRKEKCKLLTEQLNSIKNALAQVKILKLIK